MKADTNEISLKVPHRITGFFEIVDKLKGIRLKNPERIGSRGAGFTLNAFGKTKVISTINQNISDSICKIYIDNVEVNEKAATTNYIFEYIKPLIDEPREIKIFHNFDLPVECGYGASGSGALGAIFCLNRVLNLGLSDFESGKIAHISEVINKTGLGTVCGQLSAGFSVLTEPGYPCNYKKLSVKKNIKVICTSFGKISTKSFLSDNKLRKRVKKAGKYVMREFLENPSIEEFAYLSLEFLKKTHVLNILHLDIVEKLITMLNQEKIIGASMNQLGRSVFALCLDEDVEKILKIFESFQNKNQIHVLEIHQKNWKEWF